MGQPWLRNLETVPRPDLVISSPDDTLVTIVPLLEQVVGFDLETGADIRSLNVAIASESPDGVTRLVVGADPVAIANLLEAFSVVQIAPSFPQGASPSVIVGLHGFGSKVGKPESSFTIQMIDDWGIDDVMASAFDLASRNGLPLAALIDLAVLDPAFDSNRTVPGGLDMTRLLRAARAAGRRSDLAAAGIAKAGSDLNLAYSVLSFCAGLVNR